MRHQHISVALLGITLLTAGSALAQVRYVQVPDATGGSHTEMQGYLGPKQPFVVSTDQRCLTRKSDGHTECHTYAEWERIAEHLKAKANRASS